MKHINAIIIEDEIPAARLLKRMLCELRPEWSVEIIAGSIQEASAWFESNTCPDLMFLDINLTDGNSFTFLENVKPECPIIFTTAYDEYAVRAFTVNSIDYLLKPVHKERLETALSKFEKMTPEYISETFSPDNLISILKSIPEQGKRFRSRFLISRPDKLVSIQVKEIALFYSENKATYAVTFENSRYLINMPLEKIADQLDPDVFFRTNRQSIVNIEAIKGVEQYFNYKLLVQTSPKAPFDILVSKERQTEFKMWLNW